MPDKAPRARSPAPAGTSRAARRQIHDLGQGRTAAIQLEEQAALTDPGDFLGRRISPVGRLGLGGKSKDGGLMIFSLFIIR